LKKNFKLLKKSWGNVDEEIKNRLHDFIFRLRDFLVAGRLQENSPLLQPVLSYEPLSYVIGGRSARSLT
jgi:hypothetical protein